MPNAIKSPDEESRELRSIRNAYGSEKERRKRELICALMARTPLSAGILTQFHENLLFLRAFPGDEQTLELAVQSLGQIERKFEKLSRSMRAAFDDTGIAGSASRHAFAFPIVQWLARKTPAETEIDWANYKDASLFDCVVHASSRMAELDGFDSGEFETREWIDIARPKGARSDMQWIVATLSAAKGTDADQLWTAAEPPVIWKLNASPWSVTHNVLRNKHPVLRKAMRRPPPDPVRRIATPLRRICTLSPRDARKVLDVARAALTARCREVVPTSYANENEVHWCDLGEGAALAVIGSEPQRRMSIEANYGYVLFSNGVPIGYGGVTALFRQANTGINIFDPFRGSEAGFLWIEMLRAFRTLFKVTRFIINGYQFGEENAEAIESGAYWFYYRLGFRAAAPTQRKLAAREWARLNRPGAKRSNPATLKKTGDRRPCSGSSRF